LNHLRDGTDDLANHGRALVLDALRDLTQINTEGLFEPGVVFLAHPAPPHCSNDELDHGSS
jgi:hypothetical protein